MNTRDKTSTTAAAADAQRRHGRFRHLPSDGQISAAIVDRLTFAGQIIETGTSSYRLAHARRQQHNAAKTKAKAKAKAKATKATAKTD